MKISYFNDVIVSKPLHGFENLKTGCFPSVAVNKSGDIVCVYRLGATKHSYDGIFVSSRSRDGGLTWEDPVALFKNYDNANSQFALVNGICACSDGAFVAALTMVSGKNQHDYIFDDVQAGWKAQLYTCRSWDGGRTWDRPEILENAPSYRMGISGLTALSNGAILLIGERVLDNGAIAVIRSFSEDKGFTCEPFEEIITDARVKLSWCDARQTLMPDGSILMLLWTFRIDDEKTLNVHKSISCDMGITWSRPAEVAIQGQVSKPLALGNGALISLTNCRQGREGIRLWHSTDSGKSWDKNSLIQLWDAREEKILAKALENDELIERKTKVWQDLPGFSFGSPDAVWLNDGSILMVYYGTEDGHINVRACRFHLVAE